MVLIYYALRWLKKTNSLSTSQLQKENKNTSSDIPALQTIYSYLLRFLIFFLKFFPLWCEGLNCLLWF